MTTHHYRNRHGEHVYSRNGLLVALIEPERDHYVLRRVRARRELAPVRYVSFESAERAALRFATDSVASPQPRARRLWLAQCARPLRSRRAARLLRHVKRRSRLSQASWSAA